MSKEYGAGNIQVLEGHEAVRKRPAMYIGSTDVNGLHYRKLQAFIGTNLQLVIGLKNHALSYSGCKAVKGNKGSSYPLTFKWPD